MENRIENLNLEPYAPYEVSESIVKETADFLQKSANPELKFEEWQRLSAEFEQKAKENPEYRLAYLRQSTKNPDAFILAEMHEIEHRLRSRDSKSS